MKQWQFGRIATAHLKTARSEHLMIKVIPEKESDNGSIYNLFLAHGKDFLGRILFDAAGCWIYDGDDLTVEESEEMAAFIERNAKLNYAY